MNKYEVVNLLNRLVNNANKEINDPSFKVSYSLEETEKEVIIKSIPMVYKDKVISGHIGSGRQWKTKGWTPEGDHITLFKGKLKESIVFLSRFVESKKNEFDMWIE